MKQLELLAPRPKKLTHEEAEQIIQELGAKAAEVGRGLQRMREQRGFVSLGYETFGAYLEAEHKLTEADAAEYMSLVTRLEGGET